MLASQVAQEEIVELAAMTAHNVNNALRAGLGETVKPAWQDCLPSFRKTVMQGVLGVIQGNGPEKSHESWTAAKAALGWTYGPVENEALKTHPCMVPYAQLPDAQKQKDTIFIATVKAVLRGKAKAEQKASASHLSSYSHHGRKFSSGSPSIDNLLGGGLVAGTRVLVTGGPGTGKSILPERWLKGTNHVTISSPGLKALEASLLNAESHQFLEQNMPFAVFIDPLDASSEDELKKMVDRIGSHAKKTGSCVIVTRQQGGRIDHIIEHAFDVVIVLERDNGGGSDVTVSFLKNRYGSLDATAKVSLSS